MAKVSIIIPSYNCKYVAKTVDSVFENATGEIEVLVILDHYTPDPPIKERKNLIVFQKRVRTGMRNSINLGSSMATGKYLMKLDDHCLVSPGFDETLQIDVQDDWLVIPSRYGLDILNWKSKWYPMSYDYAAYPYVYYDRFRYGIGLFSKKWEGEHGNDAKNRGVEQYYWRENERIHLKIDDIMIFPGACWFTSATHFKNIDGLSETLFNTLYQEPIELVCKTWLSGGRVVVNKHTYYAHMYKTEDNAKGGDTHGRGYVLNLTEMRETERFGCTYWMNNCWKPAIYPIEWLIEKFWPIPGWPENWRGEKIIFEKKYMKKELEICGIQY